jgi:hypothetical protein
MESLRALLETGVANTPDKIILSADGIELTWSGLRAQAAVSQPPWSAMASSHRIA